MVTKIHVAPVYQDGATAEYVRWLNPGDGTLHMQCSKDNKTWTDVFQINITTGRIFFPNTASFAQS